MIMSALKGKSKAGARSCDPQITASGVQPYALCLLLPVSEGQEDSLGTWCL